MSAQQKPTEGRKLNPLSKVFVPRTAVPECKTPENHKVLEISRPGRLPQLLSDRQFRELSEKGDIAVLISYHHETIQGRFGPSAAGAHHKTHDQLPTAAANGEQRKGIERHRSSSNSSMQSGQPVGATNYMESPYLTEAEDYGSSDGQESELLSITSGDSACSMGYDRWDRLWADSSCSTRGHQDYAEKLERWKSWDDDEFVPYGLK